MSEGSQNDGSKKSPSLAPNEPASQADECGAQVDATTFTHTNSAQVKFWFINFL